MNGFGVDTGHVQQLSGGIAGEQGPTQSAAHKLSGVYAEVHAHPHAFDSRNHWAQVNNALSEASQALDGIAEAVKGLADGLAKTAHGYQDAEDNIQDAYKKALSELPSLDAHK